MISKGVLLAAGLGTRLVPYSKEMPKEMLPIFYGFNGKMYLKPVIQVAFEQLYDAGYVNSALLLDGVNVQ
jgi:UDP-glucose pyrophosphorylase (EC 2.7.7.9)